MQVVTEFVMKNRLRISYSAVSTLQLNENLLGYLFNPLDTGLTLTVQKTFRRRPGHLLNV